MYFYWSHATPLQKLSNERCYDILEIMGMRKILMLITSVRVKIQLNL